eukprot:9490772-Pyramimonas_sp.AAC.1
MVCSARNQEQGAQGLGLRGPAFQRPSPRPAFEVGERAYVGSCPGSSGARLGPDIACVLGHG